MSKPLFYTTGILASLFFLACTKKERPLFQQLPPAETGIHFSNRITENDTFNILSYEYVYNGGGVAIADFNNDGLQDLFFTGNMNGNKLYLNRGSEGASNFKFDDVTEAVGVAAKNRWNSGVAVVDINNDGWPDLYVCATTYAPGSRRANSLFVNNGGLQSGSPQLGDDEQAPTERLKTERLKTEITFTESAAAYGIADTSHTTNAAFFDYDNDGDLDLYLLINQMDKNAIPNRFRTKITDGTSHRTDKLFRNDFDERLGHAFFTDVSKEAGITIEGFGLGLNICDINQDGWKDIYVTNDYLTNDLLWMNQGISDLGGTSEIRNPKSEIKFVDRAPAYFKHTSYSAMGNDVADLNNDGLPDIVAVDMLPEDNLRRKSMLPPNNYSSYLNNDRYGYQYQYARNTLQLHRGARPDTGEPLFSDVSMLSGISSTDWSWAPLAADFDLDGDRDIIITNGFPNDVTDRDFMDYNSEKGNFVTKEELLKLIPKVKIRNYAFRNQSISPAVHQSGSRQSGSPTVQQSGSPQSGSPAAGPTDGLKTERLPTDGLPTDGLPTDGLKTDGLKTERLKTERLPTAGLNDSPKIPTFENVTAAWGITQNSFSNGAAYADLDNDGDLDYVANNINDSAFVFRNMLVETRPDSAHWLKIKFKGSEKNRNGLGATVAVFYKNGQKQFWENTPYRGYLSSVESGAHFGLGSATQVDSIAVTWQAEDGTWQGRVEVLKNVPANQVLTVDFQNAAPSQLSNFQFPISNFKDITASLNIHFTHPESDYIDFNVQRLLPHKLSQYGPALAVADVNGDGLDDFYLGGSHFNKGKFFVQQADGRFEMKDLLPGPDGDAKREEELGALFFDADNDGDPDLYLASGGYEFALTDTAYQDRLFLNENGQFVLAKNALPNFLSSGSCVKAADFDRDGDLDLFVGGRVLPFQYPLPVSSYLLRNDTPLGGGAEPVPTHREGVRFTLANPDAAPVLENIGLVCDALWTDFDNDGWTDLLLAGEWMPLTFLKNEKGKLTPLPQFPISNFQFPPTGWWNSLAAADFDLDGDMDYVAGNLGTNTLLKASEQQPIAIYAADFDANTTEPDNLALEVNGNRGLDALPAAWFPDKNGKLAEFPFFGRADMDKQLVAVKRLYLHHNEYAVVTMQDILKNFPNAKPLVLKANHLKTSYVENLGNGKFALHELPAEAQLAPVFGMVTGDFNGDNLPDVLLTGNDYGTEVGQGRYDALNGLLLIGDGHGNFAPATMQQSGICLPGDGKSLVQLQARDGGSLVVASQNRGPLKVFKKEIPGGRSVALQASDCAATVRLADGRTYREELPYGNSFLSQSARRLWLPVGAVSVEIIDFKGNKRRIEN